MWLPHLSAASNFKFKSGTAAINVATQKKQKIAANATQSCSGSVAPDAMARTTVLALSQTP